MKNKIAKVMAFFAVLILQLNVALGQAPSVAWSKEHWPPNHPVNGAQDQDESGEDWYYDHQLSLDTNGKPNGYICAGYAAAINWAAQEDGGCFLPDPGVYDPNSNWYSWYCPDFYDSTYLPGQYSSCMALTDLCGDLVWFKTTYLAEEFWKVIQTSDGNYVAIGRTPSVQSYDPSTDTYNPVYYNPTSGNATNEFYSSPSGNCASNGNSRKMLIVKMDRNGNTLWQYLYGIVDYTSGGSTAFNCGSDGWDIVETDDGNLMAVGMSVETSSSPRETFVIEVNSSNGYVVWKDTYSAPGGINSRGYVITKSEDGYIIGGTHASGISYTGEVYLMAIDKTSSHTILWGDPSSSLSVNYFGNSSSDNNVTDTDINADNEILLPVLVNISGNDADGRLYKVDASDGSTIGSYIDLGSFVAFDLKIGVTATSDGGFAIVGTRQPGGVPTCPNPAQSTNYPNDCPYSYDLSYWGTDAYVAKYSSSDTEEWSKTWDSNSSRPAGSSCSWTYPDPNRLDVKMQECMYSIVETSNGGLVVAGNSSSNFDDCYISKLDRTCSNLSLSGLTITTNQEYLCQVITASTVTVSNPGDVDFIAENSITLNPGFYAETNKKFVALIASNPSCGSPKMGAFNNANNDMGSISGETNNVKTYPNPFSGIVTVDVVNDQEKNVTISVVNTLGKEIYRKEMGSVLLVNQDINLSGYADGIYIIKVKSNNTVISKKVTLVR